MGRWLEENRGDSLENYTLVEQNGVYVARRSRLDMREGPGVRIAMQDAPTEDRVTARVGKRALGAMSVLSSAEGIPDGAGSGWVTVSYDTAKYNMGGVTIVGTRAGGNVGHQVLVSGVWQVSCMVMYNTGVTQNKYAGLHCDNTTRYGTNNPNIVQTGPLAHVAARLVSNWTGYLDAGDTVYVRTYNEHTSSLNLYYSASDTLGHISLEFLGEPDSLNGWDFSAKNPTP